MKIKIEQFTNDQANAYNNLIEWINKPFDEKDYKRALQGFTVTVDGACGFHFVMASGWSSVVIDNYFVAPGVSERVQVDARGVVDYVLQIPDGWRVKEYKDVFMGETYFDITAPSDELIAAGVGAADGDLKVVAVL